MRNFAKILQEMLIKNKQPWKKIRRRFTENGLYTEFKRLKPYSSIVEGDLYEDFINGCACLNQTFNVFQDSTKLETLTIPSFLLNLYLLELISHDYP